MKTARELEAMFGLSPEEIVSIDENACNGVLQGRPTGSVTGPGRPPIFEAAMQQVTFKEPADRVIAMDKRAAQLGMRRSDYLRQLVENDLRCVGMA